MSKNSSSTKALLLGGAMLGGWLVCAPAAFAQAVNSESNSVGEIVVTAQRRAEVLRDVPISISAFTRDQIENSGARDTLALTKITPGLVMDRVGGFTLPSIRGVTTQVTAAGGDPNVAIYVDGVYMPTSEANTFSIPDIERIEILKGPQGTLFGRNATGGAIQILTQNPGYDLRGKLTASYGRFDDRLLKGFVSVPLVDRKLSMSLSGLLENSDGYLKDMVDGHDAAPLKSRQIRGKLQIDPSDGIRVLLSSSYSYYSDASQMYGSLPNGNTRARLYTVQPLIPTEPWRVSNAGWPGNFHQISKTFVPSGRVELDIGPGTLTSLTAYYANKVHSELDADGAGSPGLKGQMYVYTTTNRQFSEELTYASKMDGPFNFSTGLYYSKGFGAWDPLGIVSETGVPRTSFALDIWGKQKIRAFALFGEGYLDVTDRLHLIGGLRWSDERRALELNRTAFGAARPAVRTPAGSETWQDLTPRFVARYDLNDRANIYASYTEGFKSGIFASAGGGAAGPEHVKSYEAGFKGVLTNFLELNASVFHLRYKDLQVNVYQCIPAGSPNCVNLSVLQNAGLAESNGAEFDANLRLSKAVNVRAGLSLLDSTFKDFRNAAVVVPNGAGTGSVSTPIDATGNRTIRAPKVTFNITPSARFQGLGGDIDLQASLYYSSSLYYHPDNRIKQPAYATIDARASWTSEGRPITISIYGNNLTDKAHLSGTFVSEIADVVYYAPPRTYGVEVSYQFR